MSVWLPVAMFAVIVTWVALLVILVGLGLGLRRLVGLQSMNASAILLSPWTGLAIVILFLQIWHFQFAVRWPAMVLLMIVAAMGILAVFDDLIEYFQSIRIGWKLPVVLALLALWAANRAIGPGDAFDSGMYHYGIVRWNHEFAIIPGLANLHPNHGFNNSCHLFDALLKIGPWTGRANHLANGLLVMIWLWTAAISGARLLRGTEERAQSLFNLLLAVPMVMYGVSKEVSSPTSDLPQSAVTFAAASALVALLERLARRQVDDGEHGEQSMLTISAILLSAAAICVKLSAGPMAVTMGLLAFFVYLLRRPPARWLWTTLAWSFSLSFLLIATWIGRSVILTGYPFYPSKTLPIAVDWRVPPDAPFWLDETGHEGARRIRVEMLQRVADSQDFHRLPGLLQRPIQFATQNPGSVVAWMIAMITASAIEVALPAVLAVAAMLIILWRMIARRGPLTFRRFEAIVLLAPLVGTVAWVILAPDPRFGASAFWIGSAALVALALRDMRRPSRLVACVAILSALPIAYRMLVLKFNPASGAPRQALVILAGTDYGFHPVPVVQMRPFRLTPDLAVYVPVDSVIAWDGPNPHGMNVLRRPLRLRQPFDLASGFKIDPSAKPYLPR